MKLEKKALQDRKYPLPLIQRELDAKKISKLKLSGAGVRKIELSEQLHIWGALKSDGVGTKILIAEAMEKYNTIGIDAVAMSVNDIISVGAKPLMVVDYIAQNKDDFHIKEEIINGVVKGCDQADAILVGGETATLSDMIGGYGDGYHFDLSTTCFGIIPDKGLAIGDASIKEGDVIIGLNSNGLHSNGYLWARPLLLKEFNKKAPYYLHDKIPSGECIGDILLKPTLIYVKPVMNIIKEVNVKGISHITGGAYQIKLPRIAPEGISFVLDNMPEPPWIFEEIRKQSKSSYYYLYEAFNMGIGMCIVISPRDEDTVISISNEHNFDANRIGYAKKDIKNRVYIPSKNIIFEKVKI